MTSRQFSLAGALRGAGATRAVMLVDVITGFGVLPPLAYLFGVVLDGGSFSHDGLLFV